MLASFCSSVGIQRQGHFLFIYLLHAFLGYRLCLHALQTTNNDPHMQDAHQRLLLAAMFIFIRLHSCYQLLVHVLVQGL